MKSRTLLATLIAGTLCLFAIYASRAQDIDSMSPVVVKTVPEAGRKDVSPGVAEIKVTFSKEMADKCWSFCYAWKDSIAESAGEIRYEGDHKTCVWKVKLEPNKTYAYWLNTSQIQNFKDTQGHPAVPYLLVFQTKGN
jgi:hypothetical protein